MTSKQLFPTLLMLVSASGFSGCANVQTAYAEFQDQSELAHVQRAKTLCTRSGFQEATDAYAQCVNTNVNASKDRDSREKAAFHSQKS